MWSNETRYVGFGFKEIPLIDAFLLLLLYRLDLVLDSGGKKELASHQHGNVSYHACIDQVIDHFAQPSEQLGLVDVRLSYPPVEPGDQRLRRPAFDRDIQGNLLLLAGRTCT